MNLFGFRFLGYAVFVAGFTMAGLAGLVPAAYAGFEPQAPHGGTLVDAGDDFAHVEMVFDGVTGTLSAYILDGEAEEVVPLKQPTLVARLVKPDKTLKLKAVVSSLSGEKPGETSSYSLTDPSLKGLAQLEGVLLWVNFNGRVFRNLAFQWPPRKE